MENPLLIRLNESEVVYFMGGKADMSLQYINNENLKEEEATLTQEYVGNELFGLLTLSMGPWGGLISNAKAQIEFHGKKANNVRQRKIGEAHLVASAINLEVEIEKRDVQYKGTEYNVHLAPSNSTYNILNKWEKVVEDYPGFPYPEIDDIKNRDWYAIGEFVSEHQDDMRK